MSFSRIVRIDDLMSILASLECEVFMHQEAWYVMYLAIVLPLIAKINRYSRA